MSDHPTSRRRFLAHTLVLAAAAPLFGASALGLLAVVPIIGQVYVSPNIAIGGTSVLILVSMSLETLRQIESRALMITYDEYEQPDYFYESIADESEAEQKRILRFIPKPRMPKPLKR